MARYYEETALIEFVKQYTPHINGETTMECVERAIREAPTADVVPKSEVEELIKSVDDMLDLVCTMTGLELTYYGKYAEFKKKYTEDEG